MVHRDDCLLICTLHLLTCMKWNKKSIKCMCSFILTSVLHEFLLLSIRAHAGPSKSLNFCQIFKALKVLENRHGP